MSPLWLSAHAHIIYSLIKDLFNSEALGYLFTGKTPDFFSVRYLALTIDYKYQDTCLKSTSI